MHWYYAHEGAQKGPVDQADFEQLAARGVITSSTLVWREGLPDWRPLSEVAPGWSGATAECPATGPGLEPGLITCAECGQSYSTDEVVRLGELFVCAGCKPIAVQKLREGVAPDSSGEIRRAHISHETNIKSLGLLYLLGSIFFILGGVGLMTGSAPNRSGPPEWMGWLFLTLGITQFATGLAIRKLVPWARIVAGILSGLGLFAFPVGTLINGYILYLLFSKKGSTVFSEQYKGVIAETPDVKYQTSLAAWIVLILLVLFLISLFVFLGISG